MKASRVGGISVASIGTKYWNSKDSWRKGEFGHSVCSTVASFLQQCYIGYQLSLSAH